MSDDFHTRAQIVGNRVNQLTAEAHGATVERIKDIHAEVRLLLDNLHEIRREQLEAYLPVPKRRRRWWRFREASS